MSGPGSSPYELLGLERDASAEEIRASFKAKALQHHPDRGGDPEKFKQVRAAYDVLSDPERRSLYDQTGSVSEEDHGFPQGFSVFPGFPGFDFSSMFGGQPMPTKPSRGPDKSYDIGVTLADLYHGKTVTLNMKRNVICSACKGKGGTSFKTCTDCNGAGMRIQKQMMGPFQTITQQPCMACKQTGQRVGDKCATCDGRCVTECENSIQVVIRPGMREGEHIVFKGQCSESPLFEHPGDLNLVVRQADSAEWTRQNSDLSCEVTVTLAESLLGFARTFRDHPSGRELRVNWTQGPVYDRDRLCVLGWGMPSGSVSGSESGSECGELIITCRISRNTDSLTEAQQEALRTVWPEWPGVGVGAGEDIRRLTLAPFTERGVA